MDENQFRFQLKKKGLLFGCILLIGILTILYLSTHP
jgi:hypothetical protein